MTNRRRTALLIAALAAVAVIIFSIVYSFWGRGAGGSDVFSQYIARAELYYSIGDYEQAAVEYRRAIDENDMSVEAYEGLSNTYVAMGDISSAVDILQIGYDKTNSQRLQDLLQELLNRSRGTVASEDAVIEPAINYTLLKRIGGSTYRDYGSKSAPVSSEEQTDGSILVRYQEVPGLMVFRNSSRQPDAVENGTISETALPDEVQLDDIASLLGKTPLTREELEELGVSSLLRIKDPVHGEMLQFVIRGCTVYAACDGEQTIPKGAYNRVVPTSALELAANGGLGELTIARGTIIDAQTGNPLEGIMLRFFADDDTSGEPLVDPVVTNTSGEYEVELPAGTYTVELSGEGYITTTKEVEIDSYVADAGEDFVVTKDLAQGEARIVLEWGAQPRDLDSYIFGETDGGSSFRLSRWEGSYSSGDVSMELDLDDRDGYGPETMTIHGFNGKYVFVVADYEVTGTMEANGATVTIYMPGQSPVTVTLDGGTGVENAWQVCTIDHGKLIIDNEPYTEPSSYAPK